MTMLNLNWCIRFTIVFVILGRNIHNRGELNYDIKSTILVLPVLLTFQPAYCFGLLFFHYRT